MAHLQYFSYPGFGESSRKNVGYSQAVRIGNQIIISGQGKTSHDLSYTAVDLTNHHRRLGPRQPRHLRQHRRGDQPGFRQRRPLSQGRRRQRLVTGLPDQTLHDRNHGGFDGRAGPYSEVVDAVPPTCLDWSGRVGSHTPWYAL